MTYQDYKINLPMSAVGQHYTICPECSATRKKSSNKCLGIDADRQIWNCNHCGWSGSLRMQKKVKREKPAWEISKNNRSSKVVKYFQSRGISETTMIKQDIQFDKGNIMFPFVKNGETVNIKYRSAKKEFRQSKNAEKIFYNLDSVKNEKRVIITEGEFDTLSFLEAGYKAVISVPDGAPAIGTKNYDSKFDYLENCEAELKNVEEFIIAVDNDKPGDVLKEELSRRLGYEKCLTIIYPDDCKDANDVLAKHGADGVKALVKQAQPFPIKGVVTIESLLDEVLDYYDKGHTDLFSTGFRNLDKLYKVRPGEMTIWTGYTGHGKSEFLDQLLYNLKEEHGWSFGICSLENLPLKNHVAKLLSKANGMPFHDGYTRRMTREDVIAGIEKLKGSFNFIIPEKVTVESILQAAKALIYRKGIKGLVIDPYNEIAHSRPSSMSETEYVSDFLNLVRRFARQNNIHIWVVAHPKKPTEDARKTPPTLYEISGSANWANKADNGLVVFRNTDTNKVEIHINKIRFKEVGNIGSTQMDYNIAAGYYSDPDHPRTWQEQIKKEVQEQDLYKQQEPGF